MITVRDYLPCDIFEVQRRNGDFIRGDDIGEASVFAATFVDGHQPVGCVGGQIMWQGVAQIWAVLSEDLRGSGLFVTRTCKKLLDRECAKFGIRRVHCLVRADNEEYIRWISLLGFEHESTMREGAPDGADLYTMMRWCDGRSSGPAHGQEGRAEAETGAEAAEAEASRYGSVVGRVSSREVGSSRAA